MSYVPLKLVRGTPLRIVGWAKKNGAAKDLTNGYAGDSTRWDVIRFGVSAMSDKDTAIIYKTTGNAAIKQQTSAGFFEILISDPTDLNLLTDDEYWYQINILDKEATKLDASPDSSLWLPWPVAYGKLTMITGISMA